MANVTFITFYNDYSIGVSVLSSILTSAGHNVTVIYFKLPSRGQKDWFDENTMCIETVDAHGDIIGCNSDVNPWTNLEIQLLKEQLTASQLDTVLISSRTPDKNLVLEIIPHIREVFDGLIICGGFGPSLEPGPYAEIADYVFVGEAENAIEEMVDCIERGKDLRNLNNLCYRENGSIVLNSLATPDIKQFRVQQSPAAVYYIDHGKLYTYEERGEVVSTHTYSTFFGRGCLNACTYCSAGQWFKVYDNQGIHVPQRRNRPLDHLKEELEAVARTSCTFILFRDEFLTCKTSTLIEFFKWYEHHISIPFWLYLYPRQVLEHPELLKAAADAGFVDTEVGFQSGSDRINKDIFKRRMPLSETIAYTRMLADYNINMKYDFIIFNPAESKQDVHATFDVIQQLPKERAYLLFPKLLFYPEAPISTILEQNNYEQITPDRFEEHYCRALLYSICFHLSPEEFNLLIKDHALCSSWRLLKNRLKTIIREKKWSVPFGTHADPYSITSHRYKRFLEKNAYKEIIVLANDDYYQAMKPVFSNVESSYVIDESELFASADQPSLDFSKYFENTPPVFVCSPEKEKIKGIMNAKHPDYSGKIYI